VLLLESALKVANLCISLVSLGTKREDDDAGGLSALMSRNWTVGEHSACAWREWIDQPELIFRSTVYVEHQKGLLHLHVPSNIGIRNGTFRYKCSRRHKAITVDKCMSATTSNYNHTINYPNLTNHQRSRLPPQTCRSYTSSSSSSNPPQPTPKLKMYVDVKQLTTLSETRIKPKPE
jgi:hypothetical protein